MKIPGTESVEHLVHASADSRNDTNAASNEQRFEQLGDGSADERAYALFGDAVDTAVRTFLGKRLLAPRLLDRFLQLDQEHLPGNIEDGRHAALPYGNRD